MTEFYTYVLHSISFIVFNFTHLLNAKCIKMPENSVIYMYLKQEQHNVFAFFLSYE